MIWFSVNLIRHFSHFKRILNYSILYNEWHDDDDDDDDADDDDDDTKKLLKHPY